MIVRLTIQQDGARFRATISKREDQSSGTVGNPETFLVDDKEDPKNGLKNWRAG